MSSHGPLGHEHCVGLLEVSPRGTLVQVGGNRLLGIALRSDYKEGAWDDEPAALDHARRLAAAWNFVDGIPTEELEKAGDVAAYVSSKTMLTGLTTGQGNATLGLEGGACRILAAAFAEQFVTSGALNYLEVSFDHEATGPLLVTLQRVQGKTPNTLRREAEKQRDELIETLEAVLKHFTRTPSTLADTTVRGDAHAVIKRIREAS